MNNYSIFSPSQTEVNFNITAEGEKSQFQTNVSGTKLYLRIRAIGTEVDLRPGELEQGVLYEIAAFSDPTYTTPEDIAEWEGSNVNFIEAYTFTADRRPICQKSYATQQTNTDPRVAANSKFISGVTQNETKPWRCTPLAGSSEFDTSASYDEETKTGSGNGRINFIDYECKSR